ncbi:MAG: hypothetical protein KAI66_02570, partial [Lentisphaeria bacterium]|nr:hypothetical protein [Lentisphaeria bacterium]
MKVRERGWEQMLGMLAALLPDASALVDVIGACDAKAQDLFGQRLFLETVAIRDCQYVAEGTLDRIGEAILEQRNAVLSLRQTAAFCEASAGRGWLVRQARAGRHEQVLACLIPKDADQEEARLKMALWTAVADVLGALSLEHRRLLTPAVLSAALKGDSPLLERVPGLLSILTPLARALALADEPDKCGTGCRFLSVIHAFRTIAIGELEELAKRPENHTWTRSYVGRALIDWMCDANEDRRTRRTCANLLQHMVDQATGNTAYQIAHDLSDYFPDNMDDWTVPKCFGLFVGCLGAVSPDIQAKVLVKRFLRRFSLPAAKRLDDRGVADFFLRLIRAHESDETAQAADKMMRARDENARRFYFLQKFGRQTTMRENGKRESLANQENRERTADTLESVWAGEDEALVRLADLVADAWLGWHQNGKGEFFAELCSLLLGTGLPEPRDNTQMLVQVRIWALVSEWHTGGQTDSRAPLAHLLGGGSAELLADLLDPASGPGTWEEDVTEAVAGAVATVAAEAGLWVSLGKLISNPEQTPFLSEAVSRIFANHVGALIRGINPFAHTDSGEGELVISVASDIPGSPVWELLASMSRDPEHDLLKLDRISRLERLLTAAFGRPCIPCLAYLVINDGSRLPAPAFELLFHSEEGFDLLKKLAASKDAEVRREVAKACVGAEAPTAKAQLLCQLVGDPDRKVADKVSQMCAKVDPIPELLPALVALAAAASQGEPAWPVSREETTRNVLAEG